LSLVFKSNIEMRFGRQLDALIKKRLTSLRGQIYIFT